MDALEASLPDLSPHVTGRGHDRKARGLRHDGGDQGSAQRRKGKLARDDGR
jgi:hypothetical protein